MKTNPFLTIALALLIFVGGVVVGNMTATTNGGMVSDVTNATKSAVTGNSDTTHVNASTPSTSGSVTTNGSAVAFNLNIATLPDAQKAVLRTMGITGDTVPITNSMLVCAEAALGVERTTAIKNGATPTMSEDMKLVSCYNK